MTGHPPRATRPHGRIALTGRQLSYGVLRERPTRPTQRVWSFRGIHISVRINRDTFPGSPLIHTIVTLKGLDETGDAILVDVPDTHSVPPPDVIRWTGFGIDRIDHVIVSDVNAADATVHVARLEVIPVLIEELEREVNERIRLTEELKALAVTDGLTGVYNRRRFDERLADEWQRWVRYGERFGLMLIDIDHFKSVNDTYGHLVGDEVLRRLGKTLRGFVRKEDVVARYGGEEFALVALGVSLEETEELAERLRVRILETPMPALVGNITVSLGISSPESRGVDTAAEVLNRADAALYRAKKSGRNQVVVSDR